MSTLRASGGPLLIFLLVPVCTLAQLLESAKLGIDAGNKAWIEGMKRGDATLIASSYAEDAVDCGPAGDCVQGRAAIERQLQDRVRKLGRATSATVTSEGSVQQGEFVYEWGEAEASFPDGGHVSGRYLTVWRKQSGGAWQIFRNMKIPSDR